jgi:hypothetical protein
MDRYPDKDTVIDMETDMVMEKDLDIGQGHVLNGLNGLCHQFKMD